MYYPTVTLQPAITFPLFLWFAATIGHVALSGRWVRLARGRSSRDDTFFDTALLAVGSLVAVLQAVAALWGVTLTSGLVGLGVWHGLLAVLIRPARRGAPAAATSLEATASPTTERILEAAAIAVLLAIAISWTDNASRTLDVAGADAAHYHVPVAVNLARGASPLDLPPTQHLYPMATSTLVAWHLVPTGDLLLVDLAIAWPFFLLASALGLLFRMMTGASGLAWTTPLVLALFATPLFRASSLVSADLLFAAAFIASVAQAVRLWSRADGRALDAVLFGCAAGLLLGSKATGIPAAALLVAVTMAMIGLTWGRRWREPAGPLRGWVAGGILAALTGGIWLARNWLLFGSPVAPNGLRLFGIEVFPGPAFEPTPYLSILGDIQADSAYAPAGRAAMYVRAFLGPAFLLCLLPALALPFEALAGWRRGVQTATVRLATVACSLAVAGPLAWLLIGAPWTSLEWTNGYSLRYVLPYFALAALFAWTALFPTVWRWYRRPAVVVVVGPLAFAVGAWLFAASQAAAPLDLPRWSMATLGAGASLALGGRWAATRIGPRGTVASVVVAAALFAGIAGSRLAPARAREVEARAARPVTAGSQVFASVLGAESTRGKPCVSRRFITLTRFDEPLALQSVELDAEVFYAARDVAPTRMAGPLGACDYVITTRAVLETEKGTALLSALFREGRTTEVADTGTFVVLTVSR